MVDNRLSQLRLGQSEALAINGRFDWVDVSRNFITDVDNIGIDLIGGEKNDEDKTTRGQPQQGRVADNVVTGLKCGNPAYATDHENSRCSEGSVLRRAAAAGIYLDGAYEINVLGNKVYGFDYGVEIASERGVCSSSKDGHRIAASNRLWDSKMKCICIGTLKDGTSQQAEGLTLNDCAEHPASLPPSHASLCQSTPLDGGS